MIRAAATASTREAARAGAEILRAGGNAVDAAVATALASCVADPCNIGIGGYGGYLVVHQRGGQARCVQFPLCAPEGITSSALARAYPEEGPECSSVPGVAGGLARALAELGRLSWDRVSEPAIRLARDGVAASTTMRRALEQNRERRFIAECFEIDQSPHGLTFRQPALAITLERMAEQGPQWFREGPLGEAACRAWAEAGVPVSVDEWRRQHQSAEVVDASLHEDGGVRLWGAPVELSGAGCVFAIVAAARRIGPGALATDRGLADLAAEMARVWQWRLGAASLPMEVAHTAHLNTVDGDGMAAALTATQGPAWFGGRWAIPGSGVIMNAGMHNFTRGGFVARAGRKLGVSNMSPTIAVDAIGDRVLVGCPGARRIPSNIALVLARHLVMGRPLQESVSAGRFHAEDPACIAFEDGRTTADLLAELRQRFAAVEPQARDDYFGPLTAIRIARSGEVEAAVDDRDAVGHAATIDDEEGI
ncbi:MAG: gamma-glutamyltransferase [Usitatibacter sp.]